MKDKRTVHKDRRSNEYMRSNTDRRSHQKIPETPFKDSEGAKVTYDRCRSPDRRINSIEVEFDAFPGMRLPAEITEIGREASLTTRTFPITLSMDQPEDRKVLAGMAGVAYVTGDTRPNEASGYVVPVSALFGEEKDNVSKVWVVGPDNRVSSRVVKVSGVNPAGANVIEGLQAGDVIATAGVHILAEGQEVIFDKVEG